MTAVELTERTHAVAAAGGMVYAARQSGLYRMGAAGEWQSLYRGWQPGNGLATLAIALDADGRELLAGIHGGVARSRDGGGSWQAVAFRAPPPLVTCLSPALDFAGADGILAGTFQDGVFRSGDGGRSWRAHNHGLFDHSVNCLVRSPSCDGVIYAGTSSGIYRSDNGGKLWQDLVMPADNETALCLELGQAGRRIYAGTEAHGLLRSADAGASWEGLLQGAGAVNAIALAADGSLVAQVEDAVLRSADDGASWSEIEARGVDCLTLDERRRQLILALADRGLRRIELG